MFKNEYKYDSWKRADHEAVRNRVGWYYYTHQLLEVSGEDAAAFLDKLYVNNIAKTKAGSAKYTTMLNEDGIIIDDVIVFRIEEQRFWISTLHVYKLMGWIEAHKGEHKITYQNITKSWDMIAVQGPRSRNLLNDMVESNINEQKFFTIRENRINGIEVKISRTGYTGELGYEIYFSPADRNKIQALLDEKGTAYAARKVTEFQVMVLTLGTEKGYVLMTDLDGANPLEIDPNSKIFWDKDFIGKEVLLKAKEEGIKRILLGFEVEDENAHIMCKNKGSCGEVVMKDGQSVGYVTKYTYGFTIEKCIGFILVDKEKVHIGDNVTINGFSAKVTERVWYDPENRKPLGK